MPGIPAKPGLPCYPRRVTRNFCDTRRGFTAEVSPSSFHRRGSRRVLGTVPSFRQELFEPSLAVRQGGLGYGTGQGDPSLVRDRI